MNQIQIMNLSILGDAIGAQGPSASSSVTNVNQSNEPADGENRSALLDSICSFNKSALKKLA